MENPVSGLALSVVTAGIGVLTSLTRLGAQVASLELSVAAHARSVVVEDLDGATSTATWWAHHTHATRAETHRKLRLGAGLGSRAATAAALGSGCVLPDQAAVIVDAVDALPSDLDPTLVARAEAHLLALATDFDAKALRRLAIAAPKHQAAVTGHAPAPRPDGVSVG